MLNPFKEINWYPNTAARRVFAKSLMIGLPCVAVFLTVVRWLKTGHWDAAPAVWLGGVGFAVGAVFYAQPAIALPFYLVWYGLACCVGFVMGNVVMALFFYGLVTGIGLLKRLGSRPAIRKSPDRQAATYWIDAQPAPEPNHYYRQF